MRRGKVTILQRTQNDSIPGYHERNKTLVYIIEQPPSLCPPCAVVVLMAVVQISSKARSTSSPVTAEHSIYLSALSAWATW